MFRRKIPVLHLPHTQLKSNDSALHFLGSGLVQNSFCLLVLRSPTAAVPRGSACSNVGHPPLRFWSSVSCLHQYWSHVELVVTSLEQFMPFSHTGHHCSSRYLKQFRLNTLFDTSTATDNFFSGFFFFTAIW